MGESASAVVLPTTPSPNTSTPSQEDGWANAHHCAACGDGFTITLRRHHCRECRSSYCYRCCAKRLEAIRCCDGCECLRRLASSANGGGECHPLDAFLDRTPSARELQPKHTCSGVATVDVAVEHIVLHMSSQEFDTADILSRVFEELWPHVSPERFLAAIDRYINAVEPQSLLSADASERLQWAAVLRAALLQSTKGPGAVQQVVASTAKLVGGAVTLLHGAAKFVGVTPPSEDKDIASAVHPKQSSPHILTAAINSVVASLYLDIIKATKEQLTCVLGDLEDAEGEDETFDTLHSFGNDDSQGEVRKALLQNVASAKKDINRLLQDADMLCENEVASSKCLAASTSSFFATRLHRVQRLDDDAASAITAAQEIGMSLEKFIAERQDSQDQFATPLQSATMLDVGAETPPPPTQPSRPKRTFASALSHIRTRIIGVPQAVLEMFPDISKTIQREVFVGWGKREADEKNRRNLAALKDEDEKRGTKLLTPETFANVRAIQRLMNDLNGPCREAALQSGLQHYQSLLSLPEQQKDITAGDLLKSAKEWLKQCPADVIKAVRLTDAVTKSDQQKESAERTRRAMCDVGGIAVTLETDGAKLDGVYLTVQGLQDAISAAGGRRCSLVDSSSGVAIAEGFGFTCEEANSPASLAQAKLLDNLSTLSFGNFLQGTARSDSAARSLEWTRVDVELQWALVPNQTSFDAASYAHRSLNGGGLRVEFNHHETPVTTEATNATVILTSGAVGVYEAQKREMMAFLSRGVNVLGFNFRGYGRSDGTPHEHSMQSDLEAAYTYLREVQHVADKNILVKSLCMSGVAGAHLAARHPGVNLLLDQTYSDFGRYLSAEVRRILRQNSVYSLLPLQLSRASEFLVSEFVKRHAPRWNIATEIATVTGCVGVFITDEDVNTPKAEALSNIKSVMTKGNHQIRGYMFPGEHATVWLDCVSSVARPEDLTTSSLSGACHEALQRQEPKKWGELKAAVADFQASIKSDVEFDETILSRVEMLLGAIRVKHEDSEVFICRLQNVCNALRTSRQSSRSLSALSADDCGRPLDSLRMISFSRAHHPGRMAMDDFLLFIGFFKPIHLGAVAVNGGVTI
ncbi:Hypothetical protein, putative [Bodo saltans]|uniref:FYVE-type domain-containing protein n=1 Tax=Bodo saltans TaxID=75058 RepID=A0A0S4JIG7_BODSA|nr:Hypothetical protein, putative [Bodo saltans]|eukprot:CUG91244.1 Hypothetical protein, putative [Bodo saltans]